MVIDIKNGKIGVAVSGGIDSMVLLHLYMESKADFCVINIEHGIRGESSVKDSEFVANFCKTHDIECYLEKVNAPEYAKTHKISLELAARELRYAVFERFLQEKKVDKIALAHHADDNAETVFMRIFRGTGIKGLKGIVDRGDYIRPLLDFSRQQIEEYAEKNNIKYIVDESNFDTVYTRNFIRNELLPLIKKRYPSVIDSILRLSKNAEEADSFFEENVIIPQEIPYGYVLRDFFTVADVIKKYSFNATMRLLGGVKDVEYVNFADVLALSDRHNNASVDMPFGITATKFGKDLFLYKKIENSFFERKFDASENYEYCGFLYTFCNVDSMIKNLTFDGEKVKDCVVRKRADGDKFWRVNGKNKLLSDFLNEKKLIKQEKDALLVLAKGQEVYVVLGLEVAEQAKIDKNTKNIIFVKKERANL